MNEGRSAPRSANDLTQETVSRQADPAETRYRGAVDVKRQPGLDAAPDQCGVGRLSDHGEPAALSRPASLCVAEHPLIPPPHNRSWSSATKA
jgi:hypothetical protein